MSLTALDSLVLVAVGGAALLGVLHGLERALLPSAVADDKSGLTLTGFRSLGGFVEHMLGKKGARTLIVQIINRVDPT